MANGGRANVDHLVYGVPNLDAGIDAVERLLGVRAAFGGQHTGRGTHNALLSLGTGAYLEIIAPDPGQPPPDNPRPFALDSLTEPRLVHWATRVSGIEDVADSARKAGYDPGVVLPMSRKRPDGAELHWQLTARPQIPAGGLVPFLIEWAPGTPHPSSTSPTGAHLADLSAEHPHPDEVERMLEALGIDLHVDEAARPALIATIEGPNGTVVLT